MTPRTMDFSEYILKQRTEQVDPFNLKESAPIMNPVHPKIIKAQLELRDNPEREIPRLQLPGTYYAVYADTAEAAQDYPELQAKTGLPFTVWEYLQSPQKTLFDFTPFGVAVLAPEPINKTGTKGLHQHLVAPFLEYALSCELWGAQGKWTRFHQRLHTHLEKFNLLKEPAIPGRYALSTSAKKLERRGVQGTSTGDSFVLTFPWTFPLSALEQLEVMIQEEF